MAARRPPRAGACRRRGRRGRAGGCDGIPGDARGLLVASTRPFCTAARRAAPQRVTMFPTDARAPPGRASRARPRAERPPHANGLDDRFATTTSTSGGTMADYATPSIRTVALVGHGGAGKTSLAEALLARAGAIAAMGSVEKGTTVSDFDPLEKQFQHSLRASILHLDTPDARIHVVDTPGFPDFIGQAIGALDAVETAAIVVNASVRHRDDHVAHDAVGGRPPTVPPRHRQQDRRRERRLRGGARVDPRRVRQRVPADQPAGRRRQARRRLLLQPVGRPPTSRRSPTRTRRWSTR